MTLKILLAAAAFGTASIAAAALTGNVVLPGYYETISKSAGKPGGTTTRDCLTAAEVSKEAVQRKLEQALTAPGCKYTQRSFGGGKYVMAGTCDQGGIKSSFKQSGTYAPTAMTMNTAMTMTVGGKPISLNLVSTSRRIAASCPAGSDD